MSALRTALALGLAGLGGGCIEVLPLPPDFDPAEATEFASLSVGAYDLREQLEAGEAWEARAGYTETARLTTEQNWNDLDSDEPEVVPVGWIGTRDDTVYVVFRGTSTTTEALVDLATTQVDFPYLTGDGGGTHQGFTERYGDLHDGILDEVGTLLDEGFSRIAVTGHSLGGAVATLAAAALAEATEVDVVSYTFASPRVGDRDFVARYADLVETSFRITNPRDVVPGYPEEAPVGADPDLEQVFYEHVEVRVDVSFDDDAGQIETDLGVGDNHSSCRYLQEVCELDGRDDCVELVAGHMSCA